MFLLGSSPTNKQLAFTLSFAAGVMVCVSVFDVAVPQLAACTSLSDLWAVTMPFAAGVLLALAIDFCLPSDIDSTVSYFEGLAGQGPTHVYPLPDTALPDTAPPAPGLLDVEAGYSQHRTHGGFGVRERERIAQPAHLSPPPPSLVRLAPADGAESKVRRRLHEHWRLAILMFVALTLHNLPEGVGVALSSMRQGTVGASLAVAVAVHNAPEGLAIAVPVFAATKSRWAALAASIVSGLSEPVGALLTLLFMRWRGGHGDGTQAVAPPPSVSAGDIDFVLSGVAGIMLTVSFVGLMPAALGHASVPRWVHVGGFAAGMLLIGATLGAA